MKVKNSIFVFIAISMLSGCGSNIPEDISKKYYKMFVESYELYEERVRDGQFVDADGELIDFSEGSIFTDTNILEVAWEDRKRKENGEKGILTNKEIQLKNDFIALYYLKQFDFFTEDLKQMAIKANPEYANPIQAAVNLEEKVINTLKLEKEPVSANLKIEDRMTNKVDLTGSGEKRLEKQEMPKRETGKQAQETAGKVQEYIVNLVNDLTIIENMSKDIQSSYSYSQVYGSGYSGGGELGPDVISPDYSKIINHSISVMKRALNDLDDLKAPQNTEYFVLEPQLKQFVSEYQSIIEDIEISKSNNNGDILNAPIRGSIQELQTLDLEINHLQGSFADSIIANNYLEYDALLSVWKQGKNYQTDDNNHVTIPSGIKREFFQNGVDFHQDLAEY